MNKKELIEKAAAASKLTKADTAKALDGILDAIKGAIAKKDRVQLVGFGTFGVKQRKARTGRNPQTGEAIKIAASTVPYFKVGKGLKDTLVKKAAKKK